MAIAAVPRYLGNDFKGAAPGHRFWLYFRVWGTDRDTGEILWGRKDCYRDVRGQQRQEHKVAEDNARAALDEVTNLTGNDLASMQALAHRQAALAATLGLWSLPGESVAPFTTGLGLEHPLENGFAFLSPYGLPYLPGSSIKGVERQAAGELAEDLFGTGSTGWDAGAIDALFGPFVRDEEHLRQGALCFWDVHPVLRTGLEALQVEIMTPHYGHYYRGEAPPHDSGSPVPIAFLALPPQTRFHFHVDCNEALLAASGRPDLASGGWMALLDAAFRHAFDWLGFGAKTAVGYGQMTVDREALERKQAEAEQKRQAREQERKLAEATAGQPADVMELERQRMNGAWKGDNGAFLNAAEDFLAANEQPSPQAQAILAEELEARYKGILADPDAMGGKKKNKAVFKQRPKNVAKSLLALKSRQGGSK